jgi:hypothetical protein
MSLLTFRCSWNPVCSQLERAARYKLYNRQYFRLHIHSRMPRELGGRSGNRPAGYIAGDDPIRRRNARSSGYVRGIWLAAVGKTEESRRFGW